MSTGIRGKHNNHYPFSFKKTLVFATIWISLCAQVIYASYSGYRCRTFLQNISKDSAEIIHQNMLDNVKEILEQVEGTFTFLSSRNIPHYVELNLNLCDDTYIESALHEMSTYCAGSEIDEKIISGFVILGRNVNQKTLHYDFKERQLQDMNYLEQEILMEYGLQEELNQSIGMLRMLPEECLRNALEKCSKDSQVYLALKEFVEQCKDHYLMVDVMSNVMTIVFVDKNCLEAGLDKIEGYGFALLSKRAEVVFQYGLNIDDVLNTIEIIDSQFRIDTYGYDIQKSIIQPEGMKVLTICESGEKLLHRNEIRNLIVFTILINVLSFGLAIVLSRKILRPLKFFEEWMELKRNRSKYEGDNVRRDTSFGRQLFITLLVSCMLPFCLLVVICNWTINSTGKNLQQQYVSKCAIYCENRLQKLHNKIDDFSTDFVAQLISTVGTSAQKDSIETIKNFEEDMLRKSNYLPDYSYALVVDRGFNILYQSLYSGQKELFIEMITEASHNAKVGGQQNYYWATKDPISGGTVLVLQMPVVDNDKWIGTLLIVLRNTAINTFMNFQEEKYCVLVTDDGYICGESGLQTEVSERQIKNVAKNNTDETYQIEDFLIKECSQTMLGNTKMFVFANAEEHLTGMSNILSDGKIIGLIVMMVIILTTVFMMQLILTPINHMIKGFATTEGIPKKMDINTGVAEINDLIVTYNNMVEQELQLQKENEQRHEREKELIFLRSQAEFKMLQQQINPHFIFNTLEIINLMAYVNSTAEINEIVKSLASILRFSMNQAQTVTVKEEVAALEHYIYIQNIRFGEQMKFEVTIDEKVYDDTMLKFILQPLVENSISHGLHNNLDDGYVKIQVYSKEQHLIFSVCDNGIGIEKEEMDKLILSLHDTMVEYGYTTNGMGIGLKNIYRRLCCYYGNEADMKIESVYGKGTTVTIVLPRRNKNI